MEPLRQAAEKLAQAQADIAAAEPFSFNEIPLPPSVPARGDGAKVIAACNRNARQLFCSAFLISGERALPPVR